MVKGAPVMGVTTKRVRANSLPVAVSARFLGWFKQGVGL